MQWWWLWWCWKIYDFVLCCVIFFSKFSICCRFSPSFSSLTSLRRLRYTCTYLLKKTEPSPYLLSPELCWKVEKTPRMATTKIKYRKTVPNSCTKLSLSNFLEVETLKKGSTRRFYVRAGWVGPRTCVIRQKFEGIFAFLTRPKETEYKKLLKTVRKAVKFGASQSYLLSSDSLYVL